MGKKNKSKNKNKVSGSVKTQLKTEKKQNAKQKKELAALGEDDITKIVAEIEREEACRQRIKEAVVQSPLRRVNFTLTPHPFKDELIMFGGEFHDGRQTTVYGDMFFYNIKKKEWTVLRAPGAPSPRCGHQAIATAIRGGELWIFGGEFSSPSELQYHHYRDLWVFKLAEKKWEKIKALNGPSARSGHRMINVKKQLIVFGGFYDNLKDYKYFNDIHIFDLETYIWCKIEPTGILPAPRSGCILLPISNNNKILVYGGYSKERVKKDVDKGHIHDDMFLLTVDKNDANQYKWVCVRQTGIRPTARCGMSATVVQPNHALMFGGVYDEEEDDDNDENLRGTFYKDLLALDLEKFQWHTVTLSGKKETIERERRKKQKEIEDTKNEDEQCNDSENKEMSEESMEQTTTITDDDGIFTMTLQTLPLEVITDTDIPCKSNIKPRENVAFSPSARINAGMAVKHNILYLYGGIVEANDRQYTLSDFYSLDYKKLDEWKTLIADDLSTQTWFDSSSDSEEEESSESESNSDDDGLNNKLMHIDKS